MYCRKYLTGFIFLQAASAIRSSQEVFSMLRSNRRDDFKDARKRLTKKDKKTLRTLRKVVLPADDFKAGYEFTDEDNALLAALKARQTYLQYTKGTEEHAIVDLNLKKMLKAKNAPRILAPEGQDFRVQDTITHLKQAYKLARKSLSFEDKIALEELYEKAADFVDFQAGGRYTYEKSDLFRVLETRAAYLALESPGLEEHRIVDLNMQRMREAKNAAKKLAAKKLSRMPLPSGVRWATKSQSMIPKQANNFP